MAAMVARRDPASVHVRGVRPCRGAKSRRRVPVDYPPGFSPAARLRIRLGSFRCGASLMSDASQQFVRVAKAL